MNNYHKASGERLYLKLARQEHCCKYFIGPTRTKMFFEVPGNFPVKHWWQKVVVEIVEC